VPQRSGEPSESGGLINRAPPDQIFGLETDGCKGAPMNARSVTSELSPRGEAEADDLVFLDPQRQRHRRKDRFTSQIPVIPSWTDERDTPTQSQRSGRQPAPFPSAQAFATKGDVSRDSCANLTDV
jgi:hypothetical protein